MTAPELTEAEAAVVARFEAAEVPAEVVDVVVAQIASRYRDPDGARFAINDFRDWMADPVAAEVEAKVRALIQRIEAINTYQPDGTSRTHWFNCGMDEAYDNVLGWLYSDVLGEDR